MENKRSVESYERETDSIMGKVDDLHLQTRVLAEKVNHVVAVNTGLREITDKLFLKVQVNSEDIIRTSADIESKINKWMVGLVFFIAAGTSAIVLLVIEMGMR